MQLLLLDSKAGPGLRHPTDVLDALYPRGLKHVRAATEVPPIERGDFSAAVVHVSDDIREEIAHRCLAAEVPIVIISADPHDSAEYAARLRFGTPHSTVRQLPLSELWPRLVRCFESDSIRPLFEDLIEDVLDLLSSLWLAQLAGERTGNLPDLRTIRLRPGAPNTPDLAARLIRALRDQALALPGANDVPGMLRPFHQANTVDEFALVLAGFRDDLLRLTGGSRMEHSRRESAIAL